VAKKKRADRETEKRRAAFVASQQRIARRRTFFVALLVVPVAGSLASLACGAGTPLEVLCAVPRDAWLLIGAALFGSWLGLTIRLRLERRRFERGTTSGRAA
jgi:hypothetical protein